MIVIINENVDLYRFYVSISNLNCNVYSKGCKSMLDISRINHINLMILWQTVNEIYTILNGFWRMSVRMCEYKLQLSLGENSIAKDPTRNPVYGTP